ncbi:MAG: hypothetical protein DHS80DRAFT_33958 [Piptocephalis tieghemiana]|nr:MAG: hypothetical protein DHS80DRAFT_33958 [Piptocephalis tieghemiana]
MPPALHFSFSSTLISHSDSAQGLSATYGDKSHSASSVSKIRFLPEGGNDHVPSTKRPRNKVRNALEDSIRPISKSAAATPIVFPATASADAIR